jgi:hypothetical protein
MKTIVKSTKPTRRKVTIQRKPYLQGYPLYPDKEDIYDRFKKEEEINPEDTSKTKSSKTIKKVKTSKNVDFKHIAIDNDLDVPGSELDDEQEIIGSEDEENNYYSIGGDNHNDLEEDNDE